MPDNLDSLYQEIILDHYRRPRNRGRLPVPPASSHKGFNLFCGDEVELFVETSGGSVVDIKLLSQGCAISQASASLLSVSVKGRTIEEIHSITNTVRAMLTNTGRGGTRNEYEFSSLGELSALSGVGNFPVRIKCALLAWETLAQGLGEYVGTESKI
jgi:nitrogen fixation NifU-like protein